MSELEGAWERRGRSFEKTEALRVFHGPGEGSGGLANWAIDRFGEHYWVTEWEGRGSQGKEDGKRRARVLEEIRDFLRKKKALSAVVLARPKQGVAPEPEVLLGEPPRGRFTVKENGLCFRIQLLGTRHPGLFLDHAPLRLWLRENCRGMNVLNTFAYTGSLSVAAGAGGASEVLTLDLSRQATQWAEENWKANELPEKKGRFIFGDVFEWLPRLKKEGREFDCVILDPPSFSRGKKGNFSTERDLGRLHALAMALVKPGGFLVSSINSAKITPARFESELSHAARAVNLRFQVVAGLGLPETFPTLLGEPEARYLKGLILRRLPAAPSFIGA